tara:strand:- start:1010 stop:1576 length:567 start_codon:yes stop_codon:yes gene_type:complete
MSKILSRIICFISLFIYSEAMSYEESSFKVVKKTEIYEIRQYPKRLVAKTTYGTNDSSGFRKLFKYITGSNELNQEIKMTTPVTEEKEGDKMVMQFFLPASFTLQNVPTPNDQNINISTIDAGYYAVLRYTGRTNNRNFIKHKKILDKALIKDGIKPNSIPIKAIYNGPFTLPILRRNEVMYNIDWIK